MQPTFILYLPCFAMQMLFSLVFLSVFMTLLQNCTMHSRMKRTHLNLRCISMARYRYLFRFKVIDECGLVVARGLVSCVLHSDLSLFEYVNDGRVTDSSKMTITQFMSYVFQRHKTVLFDSSYNVEYPSL